MEKSKIKAPVVEENPNAKIHKTMPDPKVVIVDGKPRKARVSKAGTKFILTKELDETTKMPLQCKQIIGVLSAAKNKTLNREDLIGAMTAVPIVTRQPMERILGFYQSRLISGGFIKTEAVVAPVASAAPAALAASAAPIDSTITSGFAGATLNDKK